MIGEGYVFAAREKFESDQIDVLPNLNMIYYAVISMALSKKFYLIFFPDSTMNLFSNLEQPRS